MGVATSYDEKRNELRLALADCLDMAKGLLDENIWGYEDMREDYALDVYVAVKKARDEV
ncbi:hypothetical protein [Paenibacillus agilis]|uniref:hypothetical protein n=1 Tax=Paenibacillus agilis TaxID=3020863 RepID=UPI001649BAED|nr:hypothetical protein [Paenibacillus agilis]